MIFFQFLNHRPIIFHLDRISLDIVPACLWKDNELPTDSYEVVGWGSRVSNLFFIDLPVWEVENDEVFPIVTELCDETCQVNKTKPLELRLDKPNSKLRLVTRPYSDLKNNFHYS